MSWLSAYRCQKILKIKIKSAFSWLKNEISPPVPGTMAQQLDTGSKKQKGRKTNEDKTFLVVRSVTGFAAEFPSAKETFINALFVPG